MSSFWFGVLNRYYETHPFTYRFDPVPGITCYSGRNGYYRRINRNKNYVAQLLESQYLFPNDGRFIDRKFLVYSWGDDHIRYITKSWKQKKIKKQWMKNIKE